MYKAVPQAGTNWRRFLGMKVCTADEVHVGTVAAVLRHDYNGMTYLEISQSENENDTICVPVSIVGIVTSSRVFLDLTSDRIVYENLERLDCFSPITP